MTYREWHAGTAKKVDANGKLVPLARGPLLASLDFALRKFDPQKSETFHNLYKALSDFQSPPPGSATDETGDVLELTISGMLDTLKDQVDAIKRNYPDPTFQTTAQAGQRAGLLDAIRKFDKTKLKKVPADWKDQRGPVPIMDIPGRTRFEGFEELLPVGGGRRGAVIESTKMKQVKAAWALAKKWSYDASKAIIVDLAQSRYERERYRYFFDRKPPGNGEVLYAVKKTIMLTDGAFGNAAVAPRGVTLVNYENMAFHALNGEPPPGQGPPAKPKGADFGGLVWVLRQGANNKPETEPPSFRWRIYIGKDFWARGPNTQAKTIYHEMTHKAAGTIDYEGNYGPDKVAALAASDAVHAGENADNFAYYAMSFMAPKPGGDVDKYTPPNLAYTV